VAGQFVLLAMIALLGAAGLGALPPTDAAGWLRVAAGAGLLMAGLMVGGLGIRALRDNLTPLPRPREGGQLVEDGIYARIRHPLYAALILAGAGWSLATATLGAALASAALAVWLDLKARREEAWLTEQFDSYRDYQRRTARFIPGLY
jgi:protein-S-isoprenylcysteine O-methyltransferase Ste14